MKRIGCMAVHYGKEYLRWAVWQLSMAVDEVHIFYTALPSFGFSDPTLRCPDTESELEAEARRLAACPVIWHRVTARNEIEHRDGMLAEARRRGATTVVIADADEVWDWFALEGAIVAVEAANSAGRWLARFHNFWRSWQWTVTDEFRPVRIVDLRHPLDRDAYLTEKMQRRPVYHFGYAQTVATMRYKLGCHGHKAEFRPGWFENKFLAWTPEGDQTDLHPCVKNLWTAERTDPATLKHLELLLTSHPHRDLPIIV